MIKKSRQCLKTVMRFQITNKKTESETCIRMMQYTLTVKPEYNIHNNEPPLGGLVVG